MRKTIYVLLLTFLAQTGFSQNKFLDQLGNINKNYYQDSLNDCILYFDTVYNKMPIIFNSSLSALLVKSALHNDEKAIKCLTLYSEANLSSSGVIKPIISYLKIKSDTIKSELEKKCTYLLGEISGSKDTSYYAALYATASYFEFTKKLDLTDSIRLLWMDQLMLQNERTSAKKFDEINSLKKYLEFTYLYELYSLNKRKAEDVLGVYLSPKSMNDLSQFNEIIKEEFGFSSIDSIKEKIIVDKLNKGEKDEKFFTHFAMFVTSSPSRKNLEWLKNSYSLPVKFKDFWYTNSQSKWDHFYDVSRVNHYIDSLTNQNQWIVLDVWGTWCSPCIKELPKFQELSNKFKELEGKPIQFLSISCSSENLAEFMKKNNYDFPVMEITKEEEKQMKIRSYPTTYLITPDNKFVILPSFSDKEEIMKIFTLLDW